MHRNLAVKVTEKLISQTKDDETSQGNIPRVATISALESQGQKVGLARWEPQRNSLSCQKCHLRSRKRRMISGWSTFLSPSLPPPPVLLTDHISRRPADSWYRGWGTHTAVISSLLIKAREKNGSKSTYELDWHTNLSLLSPTATLHGGFL